jgi:hypothetical protein
VVTEKVLMSLAQIQNIVTIVAPLLALVLTIVTWLVTRERFAEFWKKWFKRILIIVVVLAGIVFLWQMGWLQQSITWPLWWLLLYSAIIFCSPIAIFLLFLYIDNSAHVAFEVKS